MGPLSKMMKPGIGSYDRFKQLFDKFSLEAGKKPVVYDDELPIKREVVLKKKNNLSQFFKKN
jgi:radical SAM superfamily enzyme YgiQ (UPF0313 family)